jgi:integrase
MAAKHLTQKTIEAAKPGGHVIRLRDGKVKGFHLVIHPNGTMVWGLSYTSPETGKRRNLTIDKAKIKTDDTGIKLGAARSKAEQYRYQIDHEKTDPKEENRRSQETRQAEESIGTVKQLFDLYIKDLELDGKRSAKQIQYAFGMGEDQKEKESIAALDCSVLKKMKTRDVTREHIADIIATISERAPVQANRVRTYLHAAFAFGLDCRTRPRWRKKAPDFQLTHNPVTLTKKAVQEKPGDRYLSKEEVKALWNSIGVDALSADLAIALKLLMATGQRVEEVLHAEWSEFDTEDKLWTIPASRRKTRGKVSEPHLVPLTSIHIKLLEELRQYSAGVYLFPHRDCDDPKKKDRPRGADSLSQAVHRFCIPGKESERKGFPKFVPKDIRRTWKTLAGSIGIPLEMRNRIQGHALRDVGSLHYDRWDYLDEKRAAMQKWTHWLNQLVTGKKAKVVKLRGVS